MRWFALFIIFAALAGGVTARFRHAYAQELAQELAPPQSASPLQVVGEFTEPLSDLTGYEIALPRCPQPIAVLPATTMAIPPGAFRYEGAEDRFVQYAYDGAVYPENVSGLKLRALHMAAQFRAMFGLADATGIEAYLKIWMPRECAGLTGEEATEAQRGLASRARKTVSASSAPETPRDHP